MRLNVRVFSFVVMLFLSASVALAQNNVSMVHNQTIQIDGCLYPDGTIYDDGGQNGSYSNGFSGFVVINVPVGVTVYLTGPYITENNYDFITIWDGGTNDTMLSNNSGEGMIAVTAMSGSMTIRFNTDGSYNREGFALRYRCRGVGQDCENGPMGMTVSNITTTSAQVNWNAANVSGPFWVNLNGIVSTVNANSLSLTGLSVNTHYDLAISSVADNWAACCTAQESFRTACGTMDPPMQESFDDYGIGYNIMPICWTKILNYDDTLNEPQIVGNPFSSSPGALRLYCGSNDDGNHYSMAIGPRMNVANMATMSVRLSLRAAYSGTYLIVGVCDSTTRSTNNFTPVDTITINNVNTWEVKVVDLSSYTGSGKYVAFRMQRSLQTGNGRFLFIDDVALLPCGAWNERLYNRTYNSMWLAFDTIGSPTVNIEYGVAGFVDGTGTTVLGVASPYQLTGLAPSTEYEVRVHPMCGNAADGTRIVRAYTLEHPLNSLNLCEGFEYNTLMSPGWRRLSTYDDTPCTSTYYPHSGGRGLRMRPYYTSTMPIAVLPAIDTVAISSLTVAFYLYSDGYSTGCIEVGVMEYPEVAGNFVPVDTVYCSASRRWQYKQVSLHRYSGNGKYIALRAFDPNTSYNSMYVDDLQVGTCVVGGVQVTNIGSHSVEIRWDTVDTYFHGDSVVVEYGGQGFAEGSGTRLSFPVRGGSIQTVDGKQWVKINGLTADSTYQFIVYGLCDTMVQHCDEMRLNAHTLEQDILLPYCMDFEEMTNGSYPSGWSRPSMYDNFPRVYEDGYGKHSGVHALYLRSYQNFEFHSTIVLPLFDVDSVNGLVVGFFTWGDAGEGHTMEIGVMDDPNDESTFATVVTAQVTYGIWQNHVYALNGYSGTGRYIAIRTRNNNYWSSGGVWIDDLVVSDAGATGRTVSSVTSHGATFSWQPCGREYNGAYVEWGPSGFIRGTGIKDTVDANTFSITIDTLQPNTQYDCFITALSSEIDGICNYNRQTFTTFEYPTAASYCYGFEDVATNGYPYGWERPQTYNSRPRVENAAHTGSRSLYMESYYCPDSYKSMAVMPCLEEADLTGLTLRFWAKAGGGYHRLIVGMLTNPNDPSTFDTLGVFDPGAQYNQWQQYSVNLGQYTGVGRHIAFWCVNLQSCNSGWTNIDDITINRCDVGGIRDYSITSHDVWLTWNTNGTVDSVEVEYGITGDSSTIVITNAVAPLHLENLQAGTTYRYYVRAHCHNSTNECSNYDYTFTTRTDSIVAGYCESFDWMDYNQVPAYWTCLHSYGSRPYILDISDNAYHTSGSRSIEFYTCSGTNDGNFIVMPAAENSVAGGVLSFSLRCSSSDVRNRALLTIGVVTLPYDSTTFVPMATIRPTSQWHRYTIDLGSYTGTGRHIAFRYKSLDGCFYSYMDDLGLSLCRAGDLRATDVTDQSVRLTWRQYGTPTASTQYTVEYGLNGFVRGSGTFLYTIDTSVTINGLMNDTGYQFYVWSSCQDSNLCQEEMVAIHTLDQPLATPFCTNFAGETVGQLPTGWTRCYGDVYPRITSDSYRTSGRSIQFYSYACNNWSDQTSMLAMPMVDAVAGLHLDFYYYNENSNARLQIGVMTNPHDTNTFVPLHTVRTSGGWNRIKRSLSGYSGSGHYIAFRYKAAYCSSGSAFIDNLTLRSCAITSCRLSNLGQDGVDVAWNATAGTPGVWMTYGVSGGSQSSPTFHTSSPIHISGLASATQFVVRLWPQCDSIVDNCNYEELREETMHDWVDVPYCTNFDGLGNNSFPNNWRRHSTAGTAYPTTSNSVRHSDSYSLRFYAADSLFSQAAMPTTNPNSNCVAANGLYVNFWTYFSGNTSQGRLVVGVMSDILDTLSFVGVDTIAANTSIWQHHTVSLAPYTGNGRIIAFRFLSDNGWWCECYVDDLCIEKCVASDLTISDITQNSITVSWTSQGTEGIVVEYGPRGFAHGHGTFDTLTSSPYTITGLSELTEYEFNFTSLCVCRMTGATYLPGGGSTGGTGGSWGNGGGSGGGGWGGGTGVIITTQANYLDIPYCESYDIYDTLDFPPSYRRIIGSSHLYPSLTTTNHHSGENCIALYTTTDTACYMSLPPLQEGTTADMIMTFYAYSTNGYATTTDVLHVGVMTNPDDPSTYTEISAFRLSNAARWQQLSVDFANYVGVGQYITFRFKPQYNSYTYYIDDIYVGRCGVTNVQFATTPTTVQVSWTALHNPASVTIQYGRQGFVEDSTYTPTTISTTISPYTITGIDPDSNYDFYVMAQCSDTDFALCAPVAYTLNPMLYPPYCEDFEGIPNSVLPTEWKVLRGRAQYPLSETQHGQQIMAFYPCTNDDNVVLLRPLPSGDSLNGKWVYAYFSTSSNNYIYLDFGTVTDTTNSNTFLQMASLVNGQTETLREFNVQLVDGSAEYNRFAIRARSTSGCRWIRLSKIMLSNYPYPTDLASTIYGSSSRRITWSGQYNNPYYTVEYGYGDHWQTISSDSCGVVFNNLEPGQTYQVYFISPNGERLCLPYTFTTPEALSLPYCDNFDSYDNLAVPPGWFSYSSYGDSYPRTYSSCYNSCCRTMDFYCNHDHLQYTALPELAVDSVRHLDLRFSLRIENVSSTKLVVGVMDDRTDFSTFVPVDTLTCASNSVHYPMHISLARYQGTGRYVAFRILTTGGRTSVFLDDLQVSACPLPDFTVVGAHSVRATLSSSLAFNYWIEYGPQGCVQGDSTNTLIHITANPYYITNLESNTQYAFYTRCDSATTTCAAPTLLTTSMEMPLPYCDNFDSYPNGQMPSGWTRYNTYRSDYPMRNGNGHIQFYNNCTSNSRSYAIMPDLDIDSIRNAELYMNVWSENDNMYFLVGVLADRNDMGSFIAIDTLKPSGTGYWQAMHASLNGYQGNGRFISFCFVNPNGNCSSMYIDDLFVDRMPRPELSLVSATTVRSVVKGRANVDYWIEYGHQGCIQGDSSNMWIRITTDTAYITGLDELTTYDFYHHSDSGDVTCYLDKTIATSMSVQMPYCETFETFDGSGLYGGWSASYDCSYYGDLTHIWYISYGWAQSNALDFTGYCYQWAIMPSVELNGQTDIQFTCRLGVNGYYDRQYILVGLLSNRLELSSFIPIDTIRCTANSIYQLQKVDIHGLDGTAANIAFRYINTVGSYSMYLDDIVVSSLPEPDYSLVSYNTIQVETDTSYQVSGFWVRIADNDSLDSLIHVDSSPFYIRNLNPLTTYTLVTYYDSITPTCYSSVNITTSYLQTTPYCEEFNSYGTGANAFPSGWRRYTSSNDNNRLYVHNDGDAVDYRSLRFEIYNGLYAYAVMPELDVDSVRNLIIRTSMWSSSGANTTTMFLEVGVMTDMNDINTFTVVDTLRNYSSGRWEQLSASLSRYSGAGRFIAFRMRETNGSWRSIYLDRIEVLDCDIPASIRASLNRHNVVRIDASEGSSTGFWVEYGISGFAQGSGTFVRIDSLPTDFTLNNSTTYDFYFYCDTSSTTCIPKQIVSTLPPPLAVPLCMDFDTCRNNNMPYGWHNLRLPVADYNDCYVYNDQSHTAQRSLRFCSYYAERQPYAVLPDLQVDSLSQLAVSFWMRNDNCGTFILDLGVMSDPYDASSFITIKRFTNTQNNAWQRMQAALSDAPADAHFIAFRLTKTNNYSWSWLYLDDLYITPCGASDLQVAELASDHITFDWHQAGQPTVSIEYGPNGFASGMGTTVHPTVQPYTITGLDNLTNYEFRFCAICDPVVADYCHTNYCDTVTLFTPAGGTGCIDPTNLVAEYTTCTYGTYSNPRSQIGRLDYGYQSALSRHTVHYDTTERDPRTGGLLRTIPEGAEAAVRLGNWTSNTSQPEAESITYSMFVDPASFDLLILKYAAVLQDPEHSASQQPRFSIEILDENNNLIDSRCGTADFIANASLGWNEAANDVLWKDWTTVGLDMSSYANQTVRIRLTTYDCGEGSHYGYAYFTLGCLLKNIIAEHCGDVEANTFTMPAGFGYNWYTDTVTKTTLYNTQTITIPTTNTTYYCDLSFVDDASCYFTMSAYAGTRYPLALFDSTVAISNCQFYVQFNNQSTISNDGATPIGTGEGCEAAYWDFGNGITSTDYNGSTVYSTPGTYQVMLVSYIGGGACTDTLVKTLVLEYPSATPVLEGPSERCPNGDADTLRIFNAVSYLWSSADTGTFLVVAPTVDTRYWCVVTNEDGCVDTLIHDIVVHPVYDIRDTIALCAVQLPYTWRDTTLIEGTSTGLYFLPRSTTFGCDSLNTLDLTVNETSSGDTTAFVCDSLLWYGTTYTVTPDVPPTYMLINGYGCDSLLTLHLTVRHSSRIISYDTVTQSELPYSYLNHQLIRDTTIELLFTNTEGCDSVVEFHLHVIWSSSSTIDSTVCDDQLPLTWNHRVFTTAGTQYDTLANSLGGDSLMTMVLHVLPTYHLDFYDTICSNQALTFDGVAYTAAGLYTDSLHTLTTLVCDSVRTLHLTVFDTSESDTSVVACDFFAWHDSIYTSSTLDPTIIVPNVHGCDSTVTLHLTVSHSNMDTVNVTIPDWYMPFVYSGDTFRVSVVDTHYSFNNVMGCDSVVVLNLVVVNAPWPDNIDSAECWVAVDSNSFEMNELFTCDNVNSMSTPMVADLDGDGIQEIIACKYSYHAPWKSDGFHVFDGRNGMFRYTIYTDLYYNHGQCVTIADMDGDGYAELFLLNCNGYLTCYNYDGSLRWSNSTTHIAHNFLLSAVDIMGDGLPEIVCGNYIFNASDGSLLLQGTVEETGMGFAAPHGVLNVHPPYYMYAMGDIDGDGVLELCAGNTIYKMEINNHSDTTGNSWRILRQADSVSDIVNYDGQTFLVDYDNDGDMDVCVIGTPHSLTQEGISGTHTFNTYVWNGQTGTVMAHASLTGYNNWGASIPYCGDLDGDESPEIIFSYNLGGMVAYSYDTTQSNNMRMMHYHTPFGETAGFTVFDFNQDGHNEIVYRGTNQLYIVDGITLNTLCTPVTAYSGTVTEYPVVADVNGDGHAEIVVARAYYNWSTGNANGCIAVYGSAIPGAWSSARKVWNQWAYSSVNINEDLTVPRYRFDVSTRFPNGKQPFNSFLRQMPNINPEGDMFNPIPDAVVDSVAVFYGADSVTLSIDYCNQGDNRINAPYGIAVYKNEYRGDLLWVDTVWTSLDVDSCATDIFRIPVNALCDLSNGDSLLIAINDKGAGIAQHGNEQQECDTTNNTIRIETSIFSNNSDTTALVCDNFTWYGNMLITSCDTTHIFVNSMGCDSSVTLHLTVNYSSIEDTHAVSCDIFNWYDRSYNLSATDTLMGAYTNALGCDSAIVLHLTVNQSTTAVFYDTCTENQLPRTYYTLTAHGDTANAMLTIANVVGCDSTISYNLHVLWNNRTTIYDTVCDNQLPLTWNNRTFVSAGTQYDTLTNSLGSDSLLTMILHVLPTYHFNFYDTICSNQTQTFDGVVYAVAGTYTDSLHTLSTPACDSVRTLYLAVHDTTAGDTIAVACDQFVCYGNTYTTSSLDTLEGIYTNIHGCDSAIVLHLTVNQSTTAVFYDTCTENQLPRTYYTLTAHGDTANAMLTIANVAGCDSTISYNLHVLWNNHTTIYDTVCDNQLPLTWNNRTFVSAGTQYDTLTNSLGSDSLLTMILHVSPTYHFDFYDTICSNQTQTFDGVVYAVAGTYTDSLHTLSTPACDSVRTLYLTVHDTTVSDTIAVACDQFVWHDSVYTQSTFNTQYSILNSVGCDSAVRLSLTIHHSDIITDYDTICENSLIGGYMWRDTSLYPGTPTGEYSIVRPNRWSCDSTMTLSLLVHSNTTGSVYDTIVENQAAAWQYNGIMVSSDTTQMIVTLTNAAGCDSIVSYNLYIWRNVSTMIDSSICADAVGTFQWQGNSYADTLHHIFTDVHGADSAVTLIMHTAPAYDYHFYDTICDNQLVTFADEAYGQSGDYIHHLLSNEGCDSSVTLHLVVNPTYDYHHYDTIYHGDTVIFEGNSYSTSGEYTHHYTSVGGCDSVITLHLTDIILVELLRTDSICEGDTFYFAGQPLTQAGVYRDTLLATNSLMGDTVVVETLVVLPYHTIVFDTTHTCVAPPHYTLVAHTEAPYIQWTSIPFDDILDDHLHDSILYVNPAESTIYHLFADYGDVPMCPSTDSIVLEPIKPIEAAIHVAPDYLTYDRRHLEARNVGGGSYNYTRWSVQYNDAFPFTDTARVLRLDVPMEVDSLMITLTVANQTCADTDSVKVPIFVTGLFFPNVFTPSLGINKTFSAIGVGILRFEIWIYDRRGALVFHSIDMDEAWDGTHDGRPCRQEAYVYRCQYTTKQEPNAQQTVTGTVTLLR